MAKKFVRGITDVKTINNQDFDTNNVNDLLSDGQYNYIHRKKGKNEEYHNLTDNIKTLSSDNTELLAVTNNNKTTNTATLHPKHDAQKEQVLESTRNTVTINHGSNGTDEKTTVDTNPQKVLEHENLISNSQYVTIEHGEHSNTSEIKTDNLVSKLNELDNKIPTSVGGRNLVLDTSADWSNGRTSFNGQSNQLSIMYRIYNRGFKIGDKVNVRIVLKYSNIVATEGKTASVSALCPGNVTKWGRGRLDSGEGFNFDGSNGEIELKGTVAVDEYTLKNEFWDWHLRVDYVTSGKIQWKEAKVELGDLPTPWSPAPEDIYTLLAQKQDTLTSNASIGVLSNNTLCQLYTLKQSYSHANGVLKTHVKSVSSNTSVTTPEEEFNFILKINQGQQTVTFTLNEHDKTKFGNIITAYGVDSTVRINGCLFTLSDTTLTVSTEANTGSNYVMTFSDII